MAHLAFKDIELGFVRKRDGKVMNAKLIEVFRKFKSIDFINDEVVLDGETCIASSFRDPYYEVNLDVRKNSINGADGTYRLKGQTYQADQIFAVEKNSLVEITIVPSVGSMIESIMDSNNQQLAHVNGVLSREITEDSRFTINFNVVPQ